MINDFLENYKPLQESYLNLYETPEGRKVYEETLDCAREQYPQYVREIEGTADGSGVPFYKVTISIYLIIINKETKEYWISIRTLI